METVENVTLKELNCIVVWCLDQINHSTLITCTVTTNVYLYNDKAQYRNTLADDKGKTKCKLAQAASFRKNSLFYFILFSSKY